MKAIKQRRFRSDPLWLLAGVLLAALLADIFLPVSAAVRLPALPVLASGAFAIIAIAIQSSRGRREQRRDVLRAAYALLLKAARATIDLKVEEENNPSGRPYPGMVSPANMDQVMRYDPFEEAQALRSEMKRLSLDAEVALILEEGPDEPALKDWDRLEFAYMKWRVMNIARTDPERFGPIDESEFNALGKNISETVKKLEALCHERMREP